MIYPDGYAAGEECPECSTELAFDKGEPATFHNPPEPPLVYCPDCGLDFDIDWSRQNAMV